MSVTEKSRRAFVSVVEMADMVSLSKSRFHALTKAGIFPRPARHEACKRPVYDLELQQQCIDIRRTGVGANGAPALFNKKRKVNNRKQQQVQQPVGGDHRDLIEALKSLGLSVGNQTVDTVLKKLYPAGHGDLDKGEVVARIFRHLRKQP